MDPQLDDSLQDQPAEEEDEEKDRKRVSFPIRSGKVAMSDRCDVGNGGEESGSLSSLSDDRRVRLSVRQSIFFFGF